MMTPMQEDFKKESENIQAIPSFPNLFEDVNYSDKQTNKEIIEDLIYGLNQEIKWYLDKGDDIEPWTRQNNFTGELLSRTLARPLFELCFEGDKEDPKDMFILIKANPLFIRDKVIGVGGRIYFDGRIDYGQKYPFFEGKTINVIDAQTKLLTVDYYGYNDCEEQMTNKKEEEENYFYKGCELLGLDKEIVYPYDDKEKNPEGKILKKIRLYKVCKDQPITDDPKVINVLFTRYQTINTLSEDMKNRLFGNKVLHWDLPFVYLRNPLEEFGALLIENVILADPTKSSDKDVDYHFQESCFGKNEIVKELSTFQTYSAFLCNQQERLVEFIKYY